MTQIPFNIPSQNVVKTALQWSTDTTVYSDKLILWVSDSTYLFTNQQKFKKANGVNTFANLDFMPIDDYYVNSFKTRVDAHGGVTEALDCLDTQLGALDVTPAIMLTPNGVKDGKLFSIIGNTSQTDMDWSRNTVANRVNKNGLIEEVGVNVPRINHPISGGCPSVLLEPQRTNLITYSNMSEALERNTTTYDASATVQSVDSGFNSIVLSNATNLTWSNGQNIILFELSLSDLTDYTASVYVKSLGTATTFGIRIRNQTTGSVTTESISLTNEWQRISVTKKSTVGSAGFAILYGDTDGDVALCSAQLEQGSFATSQITTQGATVTRLADKGTNCGTVDDFNSEEGTLFVEMRALANDLSNRIISISDNTNTNQVAMFYTTIDNSVRANYTVAGVKSFEFTFVLSDITQFNKITIRWKENDFSLWINGIKVLEDLLGSVASPDTLKVLKTTQGNNSLSFQGEIKQLHVYKQALTDAQIQAL
jgi:hypothetical protein